MVSWNDNKNYQSMTFLRSLNDWEEGGVIAECWALLAIMKVALEGLMMMTFFCLMTEVRNLLAEVNEERRLKG